MSKEQEKVKCDICDIILLKKDLKRHILKTKKHQQNLKIYNLSKLIKNVKI